MEKLEKSVTKLRQMDLRQNTAMEKTFPNIRRRTKIHEEYLP